MSAIIFLRGAKMIDVVTTSYVNDYWINFVLDLFQDRSYAVEREKAENRGDGWGYPHPSPLFSVIPLGTV
jgi:hypothetical protein